MKKRNLLSLVCIFNVATLYFNVAPKQTIIKKKYSNETAYIYDYSISSHLEYICDYEEDTKEVSGSKYLYNRLNLWTGYYKYLSKDTDTLYIWILTHCKMTTNSDSLQNGYFRIVSKSLEMNISASKYRTSYYNKSEFLSGLYLMKYTPTQYGNSSVISGSSFGLGLTMQGTISDEPSICIGISGNVGFSSGVTKSNVIMTPTSSLQKVNMKYNFQNISNKKVNNSAPYRGDFIINCSALYAVNDYSTHKGEELEIKVDAKATSQKFSVGLINCIGHENKSSNSERIVNITL